MPIWTPSTTTAQPTLPSAPSLGDFQFEINSANGALTIGAGTAYPILEIKGLGDLPDVRAADEPRPRATGQLLGYDYASGRDVTLTVRVTAGYSSETIQTLLANLAAVMTPSANTEYPLWFQLPSTSCLGLACRPTGKSVPMNPDYANSGVAIVTLTFHATDPRCYVAPSGVDIDLASTTTNGTVTNNGNVSSDLLLKFTGACTAAQIQNSSDVFLALWTAAFGGTLNSGDILWMDTNAKSVIYWPSGETSGQPQRGWLKPGSAWFSAAVGSNVFSTICTSPSGSPKVTVYAPSAYLL